MAAINMASPWLHTYAKRPAATVRLICFPYLGGSPDCFTSLAGMMPDCVEVLGVAYPGRGRRFSDPLVKDLGVLMGHLEQALAPVLRNGPVVLFGYSMGAFLASEFAQRMAQKGPPMVHPHGEAGAKKGICSAIFAAMLPNWSEEERGEEPLHTLADDELLERLNKTGGLPVEVMQHKELQQLLLPIYRADSKLLFMPEEKLSALADSIEGGTYPVLPFPVSAYGGLKEKGVTRETLQKWRKISGFPDKCVERVFDSGHFFLTEASCQAPLAQMVAKDVLAAIA